MAEATFKVQADKLLFLGSSRKRSYIGGPYLIITSKYNEKASRKLEVAVM